MRLILLALSVALVQLASSVHGQQFQCQSEGFFVDPNDCSKFVRCVDTFQSGRYQVFKFDCPAGKLMDKAKSVRVMSHQLTNTASESQVWSLTSR